jgi:hypothetical protein
MTEDKLDRQIDLALQEMVAGDGPAVLRRRVLSRLAERPRRSVSRGIALATAAVILLAAATAVVLRRPVAHPRATTVAHRDVPQADVPQAAFPQSPPPEPAGSPTPVRSERLTVRLAPWAAAGPQPAEQLTAGEVDGDSGDIEPIQVIPLAVAPMETQRWAIAPLRLEPMHLEPLAEPQP